MLRPPPSTTRTDTRFPDTTLFRSPRVRPIMSSPPGLQRDLAEVRASTRTRTKAGPPRRRQKRFRRDRGVCLQPVPLWKCQYRSEEHTSELQSLMRISYAFFCLKKKNSTHLRPTSVLS